MKIALIAGLVSLSVAAVVMVLPASYSETDPEYWAERDFSPVEAEREAMRYRVVNRLVERGMTERQAVNYLQSRVNDILENPEINRLDSSDRRNYIETKIQAIYGDVMLQ